MVDAPGVLIILHITSRVIHKNFSARNCFASIRTYNTRLSTRIVNRTHARKRVVSGLVIQITINGSFNIIRSIIL
jgi:hypothetical protein